MLQDREETGKDVQCCFCDLSITQCFLTLHGDGQCRALDLRSEISLIFRCGFSFSEGISLACTQVPKEPQFPHPHPCAGGTSWDLVQRMLIVAEEGLWNGLVPGGQAGDSSPSATAGALLSPGLRKSWSPGIKVSFILQASPSLGFTLKGPHNPVFLWGCLQPRDSG